jgi:hypothetical protein
MNNEEANGAPEALGRNPCPVAETARNFYNRSVSSSARERKKPERLKCGPVSALPENAHQNAARQLPSRDARLSGAPNTGIFS